MKNQKENPPEHPSLRERAEERLKSRTSANTLGSDVDVAKLYHELQVQQIELQIREEELQLVLENAISATELFDLSPTGYFTLNPNCTITRLNRSGAKMLGSDRQKLIGSNFCQFVPADSRPAFSSFIHHTFVQKTWQTFDSYFVSEGSNKGYFQVESVYLDDRN
jgi:PAS domain-containing protein